MRVFMTERRVHHIGGDQTMPDAVRMAGTSEGDYRLRFDVEDNSHDTA